jgi:hypothetical protein
MSKVTACGKTIAFTGFLLGCTGAVFPILTDYRNMNGLESALLFLNRDETLPYFFFLAAFFLASGLGLAFSLKSRTSRTLAFPALVSLVAGLCISSLFAFKLEPFGWAALGGAFLQAASGISIAVASHGRSA